MTPARVPSIMRAVRLCLLVAALCWAGSAAAAPAAQVVVFHAPPGAGPAVAAARDAMKAVARKRGAAWVDASPAAAPAPAAPAQVKAGVEAYDHLRFEAAVDQLDRAAAEVDRTGAAGLDAVSLSDLFLYRGLARTQLGDAGAWDDLVAAAKLEPSRALDPARYPPRTIETYARAATAARAAPRADLVVRAPEGCAVAIDAAPAAGGRAQVAAGRHFVRVTCPGRRPWGGAVIAAPGQVTVEARPEPLAPPSDDALVIQARAAAASAVVGVQVAGSPPVVSLRRVGVDGRVQDRTALTLAGAASADRVAARLDQLLAPPAPPRTVWYRRRWVWAAGGAAAAAAILVPILVFDIDDRPVGQAVLEPQGVPW